MINALYYLDDVFASDGVDGGDNDVLELALAGNVERRHVLSPVLPADLVIRVIRSQERNILLDLSTTLYQIN